jgi:hypothetical protein
MEDGVEPKHVTLKYCCNVINKQLYWTVLCYFLIFNCICTTGWNTSNYDVAIFIIIFI